MPISFAFANAASRFAELPLVEMPISPSPARPCAMIWRSEHVLEAEIVAERRQRRDIGGEVDRGERRPAGGDRMHELHRDMRGIAARAAIAHGEQPATAAIDAGDGARRGDQALPLFGEEARVHLA